MKQYLSIGKIASMKQISIKSLRYYDEIGVLTPAYINPETNYRYYTVEQLPILDAITACIELGIPLKTLSSYVISGAQTPSLDYDRLLSDCKALAEQKRESIQQCLDSLSKCAVAHNSVLNLAMSALQSFEERMILTIPFSPEDNMNQKLLQLFMLAQTLKLNVSYPSGVKYTRENSHWKQYLFLHIVDIVDHATLAHSSVYSIPAGMYHVLPCNITPAEYPLQFDALYASVQDTFYLLNPIQGNNQNSQYKYELQYI